MFGFGKKKQEAVETEIQKSVILSDKDFHKKIDKTQIGRASCRERV